ncbi:hypothetical protein C8R47DRAFT_1164121 [Mycena vitilis]|nr:hypothetical protein C8R47DRAFT_1164121 [Mycena vitilis]
MIIGSAGRPAVKPHPHPAFCRALCFNLLVLLRPTERRLRRRAHSLTSLYHRGPFTLSRPDVCGSSLRPTLVVSGQHPAQPAQTAVTVINDHSADSATMLASLAADRTRVAELQTRILDLERALSQLRIEQSQAQERLDSYRYPVLTLPDDITSEIFTRIVPPYPHFPQLTGHFSPMILTHICRQWRDLALGTPMLWSAISSSLREWTPRIIEMWMERSRSCPLYLQLGEYPRAADLLLLETIILHRAHCEYLRIDLTAAHLHLFDGPMPLLRQLDLVLTDEESPESVSLQEVPLLRTVAFNYSAALRVIVPWAQLTSLKLYDVSPSQAVPILVQTPNLVYCQLGSSDTYAGNPEPGRDIPLPCLESLILTGDDSVTDFLPVLIVPVLHELEVSEASLLPNPIEVLTAFISTSGCRLQELHITNVHKIAEASYRRAFPLLRKLSFGMARDAPW